MTTQWDNIIKKRAEELENERDITYKNVIIPQVKRSICKYSEKDAKIIDIGSGTGYLTNIISIERPNIAGIDISNVAIEYSKHKYSHINFEKTDVFELDENRKYDICVATMVVHNLPDSLKFMKKSSLLLKKNGFLIITIPHPCFWPLKHISLSEFNYHETKRYILPFYTKNCNYNSVFEYFHRPLQSYFLEMVNSGFKIREFIELYDYDDKNSKVLPHMITIIAGLIL